MTLRDLETLANRFLPNAVAWTRDFMSAAKSGEIWKRLGIWSRANWKFVLLSLFLASLLYFRIRENISYYGSRSIPVEVQLIGGEGPMSVAVEPSVISVSVRGAQNDVRKFETSDLPIRLQVLADKVSTNSIEGVKISLRPRRDIPGLREFGLVATDISADSVLVTYDWPGDVEFFIDPPKHKGTPFHGEVKGLDFSPQKVLLHGGRKRLLALRARDTVRPQLPVIDVENLVQGFVRQYEIVLPEQLREVATLSIETNVTVKVEIVRRESTKTFEKLPLRLLLRPGVVLPIGYRLVPLHVSATVTGYDNSVDPLSNDSMNAYAEVLPLGKLDFSPGATNSLGVKIEVPSDKEVWSVEPNPKEVLLIMPDHDIMPSHDKAEAKDNVENGKSDEHQ